MSNPMPLRIFIAISVSHVKIIEITVDLTKHVRPIAAGIDKKAPTTVESIPMTTLTSYSYYESAKTNVKVLITLPGIENHPNDKIKATFKERSFEIFIFDFNGKNYVFRVPKLQCHIKPEESSYGLKKGSVVVTLRKLKEGDNWWSLFKSKGVCEGDSD